MEKEGGYDRDMGENFQKFLDRLESRIALITSVAGSSLMGVITGWISAYSEFVGQFGAIGWWFSGMLGMLITAMAFAAWGRFRLYTANADYIRRAKAPTDGVNPIEGTFDRKRIRLAEFLPPMPVAVSNKTFTACDIFGPVVVRLVGGTTFANNEICDCEFVAVKDGAVTPNALHMGDLTIRGSRIFGVTFLVPEAVAENIKQSMPGANWLN
ncbi:MAG: hypothetical protein Q7S99_09170 [Parvibaculum sp.]|nr:hypothetical protein [Parvibaculum sp.]